MELKSIFLYFLFDFSSFFLYNMDMMKKIKQPQVNIIELETPKNTEKFFAPPTKDSFPFLITEYGTTFKGIPCYQLRMNSPISCLQYVISGTGVIINNQNIYNVKAGDTFLLHAGTDQIYYSNPDNQFERIWINFKGVLSEKILEIYGLNEHVVFPHTDTYGLLTELHNVCKKHTDSDAYKNETAQFFLKIAQFLSTHKTKAQIEPTAIEGIRLHIERHIMENIKLSTIAQAFYLSEEHLIRKFKQTYGITPHRYILQSKIRIAMIMLQNDENSIEFISEQLNFSDTHHFSLQFKKNTGFSPSEYRK